MIHGPQMAILVPVKEIASVFQKRLFVLLWLPPNANGTHWTISNNNFSLKVKLAELLGRSKVTAAALEGICENRRVKKNFEYYDMLQIKKFLLMKISLFYWVLKRERNRD